MYIHRSKRRIYQVIRAINTEFFDTIFLRDKRFRFDEIAVAYDAFLQHCLEVG